MITSTLLYSSLYNIIYHKLIKSIENRIHFCDYHLLQQNPRQYLLPTEGKLVIHLTLLCLRGLALYKSAGGVKGDKKV